MRCGAEHIFLHLLVCTSLDYKKSNSFFFKLIRIFYYLLNQLKKETKLKKIYKFLYLLRGHVDFWSFKANFVWSWHFGYEFKINWRIYQDPPVLSDENPLGVPEIYRSHRLYKILWFELATPTSSITSLYRVFYIRKIYHQNLF